VEGDRLSITDAISRVAEVLRLRRRVSFVELLVGAGTGGRTGIIAAFLAVLEMAKLRLLRIFQELPAGSGEAGEIVVEASDTLGEGTPGAQGVEEYR
jgi:segregation and condensation protein A